MMFKKLVLFSTTLTLCCSYQYKQCCQGEEPQESTKKCPDGNLIDISDCQRYILPINESENKFDGENLIIDEDVIARDKYCYAKLGNKSVINREVFILCVPEDAINQNPVMGTIIIVLQIISIIFFLLTIIIYLMLPEMMDLQGVCTVQALVGLTVGYTVLTSENLSVSSSVIKCHMTAYCLYTAFLYAFFWLNLCCFNMWRLVVNPKILKSIKRWKLIYYIYGMGWPLFFLVLLATIQHSNISVLKSIHPGLTEGRCWFKSTREALIYLYSPLSILLVMNIVYFIWTGIMLWNETSRSASVLKYRLRLYISMFFVMGIEWVFEVLSAAVEYYHPELSGLWFITDSLNASIGIIIFVIFVIFRKKVIRGLANRSAWICGFRFPAKWEKAQDSECEEIEEEGTQFRVIRT